MKNLQAKHLTSANPHNSASNSELEARVPQPTTLPSDNPRAPANHALFNEPKELALSELLAPECLDADKRSGRPQRLLPGEKARLIEFVRESWDTRRMSIVDIQRRAGLGHASRSTIHKALAEAGIKAYIEEFKFILDEENMLARYVCISTVRECNYFTS